MGAAKTMSRVGGEGGGGCGLSRVMRGGGGGER